MGAVAGALALSRVAVQAQPIERNLPPAPIPEAPRLAAPAPLAADKDETPLGPTLAGVVLLGADEAVRVETPTPAASPAAPSLDLKAAPLADTPTVRRGLTKLIGRPISRRLISLVEAQVVEAYRAAGRPLVSVSTPEQELSSGVLQVRVVLFKLQAVTAPGARNPAYIVSRTRARVGQPVDAPQLSQDLDWMNRAPFRTTQAVFSPGAALGGTTLALQTTYTRPWSTYVGYADSGSPLTGFDRYIAGASVALPYLPGGFAAYQFTGSNDVLFFQDRPLNGAPDPRYLSHALRVTIPTLPRQDLEVTYSYVQSNEAVAGTFGDFTLRQTTYEGSVGYRSALSDLLAILPGEGVAGVEFRRQTSRTLFADTVVTGADEDVFQVYLGFADQEVDALGRTDGDITVHLSPGGVNGRNTDATLAAFSQNHSTEARYAYVSGDLTRTTRLPFGANWSLQLVGQYAAQPLPLTEQIGLGGQSLVRGYTLDDGAFDAGVAVRNELRAASVALPHASALSPYLFFDAGYGKDRFTRSDRNPLSTGLGADAQVTGHLAAGLAAAWALKDAGLTRQGDFLLESHVTMSF